MSMATVKPFLTWDQWPLEKRLQCMREHKALYITGEERRRRTQQGRRGMWTMVHLMCGYCGCPWRIWDSEAIRHQFAWASPQELKMIHRDHVKMWRKLERAGQ